MKNTKYGLKTMALTFVGVVTFSCSAPSSDGDTVNVSALASEQSPIQQVDEVPLIQPATLEELLSDTSIVLLDTRSPQEYATGHLRNARLVNFQTFQLSDVQDIPKDAEIIVYCAVGGRSNRVGMQLLSAGYQEVRNLEGGITNWKSKGYQVVNE